MTLDDVTARIVQSTRECRSYTLRISVLLVVMVLFDMLGFVIAFAIPAIALLMLWVIAIAKNLDYVNTQKEHKPMASVMVILMLRESKRSKRLLRVLLVIFLASCIISFSDVLKFDLILGHPNIHIVLFIISLLYMVYAEYNMISEISFMFTFPKAVEAGIELGSNDKIITKD